MASYIKSLEDTNGDTIYPQTKVEGIFNSDGVGLNAILEQKITIIISSSQPVSKAVGDYWYKIL